MCIGAFYLLYILVVIFTFINSYITLNNTRKYILLLLPL